VLWYVTAPPKFSIRPVILTLIQDGILFDSVDTKRGKLALYINDGDQTIQDRKKDNYNKYRNSCTYFMPQHPILIARLRNPTIEKLRTIAKAKHFIHPSLGMLIKKPSNPNGQPSRKSEIKISEFYMDEENDLDEELKSFLVSHNYL